MIRKANQVGIESLEPSRVWRFFSGMADIPRPSKHEEKIRAHVRATAQQLGFQVREDRTGNLLIEVPATRGYEHAPVVVLQGHLDMVCEKNTGTEHDFSRDPIRTLVDHDAKTGEPIVRADGTTLGADNGIGVALALAAASTPELVHGPLEILLTIDEEMGMTGAGQLEPDFVRGKILLNLDSEDDTVLYIGCAGGGDVTVTWTLDLAPLANTLEVLRVGIGGLRGGHSGGDIHENRGNALKTLARTLMAAGADGLRIVTISGGSKRNAIPREAEAVVAGPPGTAGALRKAAGQARAAVAHESAEPGLTISVDPQPPGTAAALSAPDTQRVVLALTALPSGVLEMNRQVPGLVQTSNNVATLVSEPADGRLRLVLGCLSRSSIAGRLAVTREQISAVAHLAGATVELGHSYPGWEPNLDSPLLATCRQVYQKQFGHEPRVTAIHAGLECGIIGQRLGKMDMISFGPHITGAHSPDERVYVNSVQKSYKFLTAVLEHLARG